jgi:ubiquinone biosynthesis protein
VIRSLSALLLFGRVLVSYGWQWLVVWATRGRYFGGRWAKVHEANARRLARGFTRLGGVFIKLGQVLSVLAGFLPGSYREALEGLQDRVPPRPFAAVRKRLSDAFGDGALARFGDLETTALAAASLSQVHRARLPDGRTVAVKLLYPGIEDLIRRDLGVLALLMPLLRRLFPIARFDRVLPQLTQMLAHETDYTNEAANIERVRAMFAQRPDVVVPDVVPELSGHAVLTMSFESGIKISDKPALAAAGVDAHALARLLVDCYLTMLFGHQVFHADPHPGNFLVRPGPVLVILDYGAVEPVTDALARGMRTVMSGALLRNPDTVLDGLEQMGFVAPGGDRNALRSLGREYLKALASLKVDDFSELGSGTLRTLSGYELLRGRLREIMQSTQYPDGYFYVERTLVLLFGLVGQLDPQRGLPGVAAPLAAKALLRSFARPASTPPPAQVTPESAS